MGSFLPSPPDCGGAIDSCEAPRSPSCKPRVRVRAESQRMGLPVGRRAWTWVGVFAASPEQLLAARGPEHSLHTTWEQGLAQR